MKYKREMELADVQHYPLRLYHAEEISKLLRISPVTWRIVYQPQIPPLKAGKHQTALTYWTDLDILKAIDLRFPDMDQERRQFLYEQLQRGKEAKRGSTEVS